MSSTPRLWTRFSKRCSIVAGFSFAALSLTMAHTYVRRSVGLAVDDPVSKMTDTMRDAVRKELENRTGETESESDGEM